MNEEVPNRVKQERIQINLSLIAKDFHEGHISIFCVLFYPTDKKYVKKKERE